MEKGGSKIIFPFRDVQMRRMLESMHINPDLGTFAPLVYAKIFCFFGFFGHISAQKVL
jgi:hypothetical protein